MENKEFDESEDVGSTSSVALSVAGNNACPPVEEIATKSIIKKTKKNDKQDDFDSSLE